MTINYINIQNVVIKGLTLHNNTVFLAIMGRNVLWLQLQ